VNELERSQQLLIAGFPNSLAAVSGRLLFLDAHTLIDNGDELYVVKDAVFAALAPDGIIHVEAEPSVIARQREADVGRVGPFRAIEVLAEHQQILAQRAQEVAACLGVWFARVQSGDAQKFAELLNRPGAP